MERVFACRPRGAGVIDELRVELGRVGIRGRLRRRILTELADHLACDPDAELGAPRELAREFADELAASRSRAAAFVAFAALSLAGCVFTACYVAANVFAPQLNETHARTEWLGGFAVLLVLTAPQVSFAAGLLALLRAFRRRGERALAAAEVRVIVRRTAVALTGGLAAMVGVGLFGYEYSASLPGWLPLLTYLSAGVGGTALMAAGVPLVVAARVRASLAGDSGDIFDDLGPAAPAAFRGRPWRVALAIAGVVALGVAAAGVFQADPIDGTLRGLADGLACLAGFAVLGRFLGLRASSSAWQQPRRSA
jgi:hypothetical protein